MAPPIGIKLKKSNKPKWKVGKRLGKGACAAVHELLELDGTATDFAIKLAPIPKKKTRKGNSEDENNHRLLHYEQVVYCNQFPDIQGTVIPQLPPYGGGPPVQGEEEGYIFFVLERMDKEISSVPELLLSSATKSAKKMSFGPIACSMLTCVQAIQERKHVVVDIKPENFMLTCGKGKGKGISQQIASRVRILDLALVQPWASMTGKRANEAVNVMAGTPLYSSLNLHDGQTPSRRDDLEALGYVFAELIMKVVAKGKDKELPWSRGKSDEDIGKMKKEQVEDRGSSFYKQLGSTAVANVLGEYLEEVRGYGFKEVPDYESLASTLSKLDLPTSSSQSTAKSSTVKRKAATKSTSKKQESPKKRRAKRSSAQDQDSGSDSDYSGSDSDYSETMADEVVSISSSGEDDSDDNESFASAMEWEPTPADENEEPGSADTKPKIGVTVSIVSGPHEGSSMNLIQGECTSIVLGRKPVSTVKESAVWLLDKDAEISSSHLRLDLKVIKKKVLSVQATDLKSSTGTFVGSEKVPKGKDRKLFRGDKVRIGSTVLSVKNLSLKAASSPSPVAAQKKTASKRPTKPEASTEAKRSKKKSGRGVRVSVIKGPHTGESIELESGETETVLIGSSPSGGKGDLLVLSKDRSLKKSHVNLELAAGKILTVNIVDKSGGDTSLNQGSVKKNARAFIRDRIQIGASTLEIQAL